MIQSRNNITKYYKKHLNIFFYNFVYLKYMQVLHSLNNVKFTTKINRLQQYILSSTHYVGTINIYYKINNLYNL